MLTDARRQNKYGRYKKTLADAQGKKKVLRIMMGTKKKTDAWRQKKLLQEQKKILADAQGKKKSSEEQQKMGGWNKKS